MKYHRELRILKENCHLHLQEEKITVDLKYARDKLNSKILYWHLIPLTILVFSGLVLWLKYPDMPEQVPVHFWMKEPDLRQVMLMCGDLSCAEIGRASCRERV